MEGEGSGTWVEVGREGLLQASAREPVVMRYRLLRVPKHVTRHTSHAARLPHLSVRSSMSSAHDVPAPPCPPPPCPFPPQLDDDKSKLPPSPPPAATALDGKVGRGGEEEEEVCRDDIIDMWF